MKLSFYGADQCVTGSCHCLEVNGKRVLIDCGLQQGRDEVSNSEFPFAANTIDFVLVTHAHIDHSGRIPMLIKQGFQGRILTTSMTARLLEIMLLDSAHIQEQDAEWKNRKGERFRRAQNGNPCTPWRTRNGCQSSWIPANTANWSTSARAWIWNMWTRDTFWAPPLSPWI